MASKKPKRKQEKQGRFGKGGSEASKGEKLRGLSKPSTKPVQKLERKNALQRLFAYFRDVRSEMAKVNWPPRTEIVASTIVVLVTITFFAVYVGALDFLFGWFVKVIAAR